MDRYWTHWISKVVSAVGLSCVFVAGLWLMDYVGDRSPQRITSGILAVGVGKADTWVRLSGHLFTCGRDQQNPAVRICTTTFAGRALTVSLVFADAQQTNLLYCHAQYASEVFTPYCTFAFAGHRDLLPAVGIDDDLGLAPEVFAQYRQQYPVYNVSDNDYLLAVVVYGLVLSASLALTVSQWVPRHWLVISMAFLGTLSLAWFSVVVLGFYLGFRWGFLD